MEPLNQPRQPQGVPTGGQFAGKTNPESDLELREQYLPGWGRSTVEVGSTSPWGSIDNVERPAPGIARVTTPSHGGYKLTKERNAAVNPAWRDRGGWYEEDCEWAAVHITFPDVFPDDQAVARRVARDWMPDAYEQVTGEKIEPGESYIRDKQIFFDAHADDLITTSAIKSDTHPGMVEVDARIGGAGPYGRGPTERFLVQADKYDSLRRHGYVIDEDDRPLAQ